MTPVTVALRYHFDDQGRVVGRSLNPGTPEEESLFYLYDGARIAEQVDGDGGLVAGWDYGLYVDEAVRMDRGGQSYYFHQDDLYNVVAVSDINGALAERYEYGDYGLPEIYDPNGVPLDASAIGNPFLFTGRRWHPELQLYHYRTRFMDPVMGRFVSRDTIGLYGDPANLGNPNAYVGNNPWSRLDPWGRASEEDIIRAFQLMYGEVGQRLCDAFALEGSLHIQELWPRTWDFDRVPFQIQIDEDLNAIESAQCIWMALNRASAYGKVRRHLLDYSGNDNAAFVAAQEAALTESMAVAQQGAQFYVSGPTILNEGGDWCVALEDLSEGRYSSIIGMLPFLTASMVKGGRILVTNGDEVVGVVSASSKADNLKGGKNAVGDSKVIARGPRGHLNAGIAQFHGYSEALGAGHIGVKAPSNVCLSGPDYITYNPKSRAIFVWDAKYRGPGGTFPSAIPEATMERWMPDVREAIEAMPEGMNKTLALDAFARGHVRGKIFRWPR